MVLPAAAADAPRDGHARREIGQVVDVRLRLVAQPVAQRQVRADAPVVIRKQPDVELVERGRGRARAQAELRRAAAVQADQLRRKPGLLEQAACGDSVRAR